MAKKTFVQKIHINTGQRWYLDFSLFHSDTGQTTRHRKDFDLNQIENETLRMEVAEIICRNLENFIELASATVATAVSVQERGPRVIDALTDALNIKLSTPRKNTHKGYLSITRAFSDWLTVRHYADIDISDFTKKHAQAYFDFLRAQRKYRGRTLNNYLIHLRALWGEMIAREIVVQNPWSAVKPAREQEKQRRPFNREEKVIVAGYIQRTDYWLFRALLLQYFCFIRPVEIARLKFRAFDYERGVVKVEAYEAKKWKTRWATIPADVLPFFKDGNFDRQPENFYVFGLNERGEVGAGAKPANETRMYKRHRNVLEKLKKSGQLKDITGLTWYSWKDTGISTHAHHTTPLSTRDQAGHTDFDMTLVYYRQEKINDEYRELKNDLQ